MTYSGKILVLGSDGYPYWKGRMEAFLVSQSQDIWDATQSTTFVVLPVAERTTQDIVAQHEANAKAVNFFFSGLGPMDYEREIKVNSIIESAGYNTIGVEALYSKLKATEVDYKMRDSLACTSSKSLALATPSSESVTNPILHNFSFSALMSVTEEQLATLGDDELCLVSSRFQHAYDNRMSKKRGERPKCFECGEVGHFIAECPNKNDYYEKGKSYSRDSDKYHSGKAGFDKHRSSKHGSGKRPFGKKNFRKAFKSYQKDNRKRDKALFAEIGFCSSGSSSSSSSSSSSDEEITYRKDKRNDQGGPAGLCFVSTKSRRKNKDKRSSVCSMALKDKENKDDGSNSSSDDEMSREFEMSLMGELQFFLGLQIKQGPKGTFVHRAKYTRDILKKFEMGDSKPVTTPMSTNTALDADEDGEAYAVCLCARYQASPRTSHRQAVKRIFRLQVEGVDNALIKGEVESQWTGLIALLV
ncbi:hypothetical protein U9M48_011277 [Paspalum notatum var. saurae]|uniref:CCHC-type domain-containing protein n=1 Tax=Paspalum notatum var. saurae TaxID=547442 RepID=A0AAQ3SUZ2_PASNO